MEKHTLKNTKKSSEIISQLQTKLNVENDSRIATLSKELDDQVREGNEKITEATNKLIEVEKEISDGKSKLAMLK